MMISGVLVVTRPEREREARAALEAYPWLDIHHSDSKGRLVITIDSSSTEEGIGRLREIQELPEVILAEMVEHYVEEPEG
jgi:nitrate reductase NapAB chaperone NapD